MHLLARRCLLFCWPGFLLLFLLLFQSKVWAKGIDNELQSWDMVTLRVDAPHRLSLYGEVQARTGFQGDEAMDRLLVRGALGYRVTPRLSLWQGYAWTPSFRPGFNDENRLFQQVLLENPVKKLSLTNRVRLEERFIEGAGAMSLRVRHLVRMAYPLDKAKKWSLVASNEFFVNLTQTPQGPRQGVDQNRTFAGLNRQLGKHVNAEAGYMWDYLNRAETLPDKAHHIIQLTLNFVAK